MKKIISIVLAVIMAAALTVSLSACGVASIYEHADKYSVGSNAVLTDTVDSLELEWQSGRIDIVYHDSREILLSEKSSSSLSDEIRMHWWVDGTTLRIHFAASGQVITGNLKKNLTVTLPADMIFSAFKLNVTSGDVQVSKITADYADLNTTSGNISGTVQAKEIKATSTSGNIALTQQGETEDAVLDTTSGNIEFSCDTVGTLKADSNSGKVTVNAVKAQKAEIASTSGKISFSSAGMPERLKLDSTSGDISVKVPRDASFTLNVDQTSGDFFYQDIALKKQGDRYVAGDGAAAFDFGSTSGDIRLGIAE